jgi:hypothetical protein
MQQRFGGFLLKVENEDGERFRRHKKSPCRIKGNGIGNGSQINLLHA